MTVRAIAGLVVFNAFVLGVGAGVLWGVRGWSWWIELVRLAGVAYFLGLAGLMILLTLELVLGIPVTALGIVLTGIALAVGGVAAGSLRARARPGLRPPDWRFPRLTLFAAAFVGGIVVYLEGLFRADRLAGIVREWDSWAFWMPRARELYFSGRLEPEFLLLLPQLPSYPPGLTTLQNGAFHAMGSPDMVSLHVQYWFFAVGFVAAVVGLLAGRVHAAILYPVLLAFLVAPSLLERITTLYADVALGYLVALAALLVFLWIDERKHWHLAAATVLLAGAMLAKREGLLFAACVLAAGLAAAFADRRRPWRPLAAAGAFALALALPWRIWFTAHGLESDGPDAGYFGAFSYLERVGPSFELAVTTLFDRDLWRIAPFLVVGAVLLAALARAWIIAIYAATFLIASILGFTWVSWSYAALPITQADAQNPIVRLTGTTYLVLAVLTPLLLQRAWSQQRPEHAARVLAPPGPDALITRSRAAWAIVALAALSHPGAMLVGYSGSGLPGGAPAFPSVTDCEVAPAPHRNVQVVIGYAGSYPDAYAIRDRARQAGVSGVDVAHDGCGRLRVFVDGLGNRDATQSALEQAQTAGLEPTLELDPS